MEPWQSKPLGFAIADETSKGNLAIHHVSVRDEGVFASGLWDLPGSTPAQEIQALIAHWIPVGTVDGIKVLQDRLGSAITSADLFGLVQTCEHEEAVLRKAWQDYKDEEPRKRVNLKPLATRAWPAVQDDGDAAKILNGLGLRPFDKETPDDMRDVIAFSRLIMYIMEVWYDLESERLGRSYLREEGELRALFPPDWLRKHSPYWPKAE